MSRRPRITRLTLATVTAVPEFHPEHATFEPFPVHAWVVHHDDGPILFDTGVGEGNPLIDDWYRPRVVELRAELDSIGCRPDDLRAIVLSHLHFDHCGQHLTLDAPVYVQRREHEAARAQGYTVPDWAFIPEARRHLVDGDAEIAPGVRLVATPGHTPGHQALVVGRGDDAVVLGGQCAFRAAELRAGAPATSNLHDPSWRAAATRSIQHLLALEPAEIHLSHDADVFAPSRGSPASHAT